MKSKTSATPTLDACVNAAHAQLLSLVQNTTKPAHRLVIYRLTDAISRAFTATVEDAAAVAQAKPKRKK